MRHIIYTYIYGFYFFFLLLAFFLRGFYEVKGYLYQAVCYSHCEK